MIAVSEVQVDYIMHFIELFRQGKYRTAQPTLQATRAFNQAIREAMKRTVWVTGCRSWYLDQNGAPALWPFGFARFRKEMDKPQLEEFLLGD